MSNPEPELERAVRHAAPVALAALLRGGTPFADAEDAMGEAVVIALEAWPKSGMPERPVGWFVRVARRRLIARHRTDSARANREALAASWSPQPAEPVTAEDDSLALLFLCCHPDLTPTSAIPLTLRAVGGLTTREIAEALLAPEATIGQRISRAKATIAGSAQAFDPPPPDLVDTRLPSVMQVIYLIFTEAHAVTGTDEPDRPDLAAEAIRLARQLHDQLPHLPETAGLLALMLLTDARRGARMTPGGELVPLDRHDRRLWDRAMITEGLELLTEAFAQHRLGEYQLQASIAALHDQAPDDEHTDWVRVLALYDLLLARTDNPIVAVNRAVAVAHTAGPDVALIELGPLAERLDDHHRYHATLGYLQAMAGDDGAARTAYVRAAALAPDGPERRYLRALAAG